LWNCATPWNTCSKRGNPAQTCRTVTGDMSRDNDGSADTVQASGKATCPECAKRRAADLARQQRKAAARQGKDREQARDASGIAKGNVRHKCRCYRSGIRWFHVLHLLAAVIRAAAQARSRHWRAKRAYKTGLGISREVRNASHAGARGLINTNQPDFNMTMRMAFAFLPQDRLG